MEDRIMEMAEDLKLLADKTRLSIVALLKERELCVCDITDITGMSQPNASQHLRKLKMAGMVNESKRGQWVYYSLVTTDKPYLECLYGSLPSMKEKIDAVKGCCEVGEDV
ncbi:ArsR family transcriptional regulator [Paenibacillus swuensis]|uniref:ArsR family transcriptional regulator n=1 Tax=Paenibacillus swuensis TaxID=1178515 RepID=A0A172TMW1_9BACL|nr:metalloregulator ArsR/SmtB family transcription factor [Paenibacillus swuensis]ANE48419.1 ArsR family transcriptional regulator [Paenibacillus swuensis]